MNRAVRTSKWSFAAVLVAVVLAEIALASLERAPVASAATFECSGVHVRPGDDLDAIVNRDPGSRGTTFCVHAAQSGTTYSVNNTVQIRSGDRLIGQPGKIVTRGPASYGVPLVNIRNGAKLAKVIQLSGVNVQLRWLDVAGGKVKYNRNNRLVDGTGYGIGAGPAGPTARLEYLTVHGNQSTGISSMNGKLFHSNLYNNGTAPKAQGWSAAAVKGVDEYEAAYNYVHDNPANGLWCDHGCKDVPGMQNGFWAHHNLLVNNGRWGVHYEYSPIVANGVHRNSPSALIERNEIHGNGRKGNYGGASMYDAQNAIFRNNSFGRREIAGVTYPANNRRAILFYDTGRRTDLWNGDAVGNTLRGERIEGCDKPDNIAYCASNN